MDADREPATMPAMKKLWKHLRQHSRRARGITAWWLEMSVLAAFEPSSRLLPPAAVLLRKCGGACGEKFYVDSLGRFDLQSFLVFHQVACPVCRAHWGVQADSHLLYLRQGVAEERREQERFSVSIPSVQSPIRVWVALLQYALRCQCLWFRGWKALPYVDRNLPASRPDIFLRTMPMLVAGRLALRWLRYAESETRFSTASVLQMGWKSLP